MAPNRKFKPALLAAVTSLLVLGACSPDPVTEDPGDQVEVSADPVILPDEARTIAEEWNAEIDRANATLDRELQQALEVPPALEVDDALFRRLLALERTSATGATRELAQNDVYVPRQTEFPARFVTFIRLANLDDPSAADLLRLRLFEKSSPGDPWQLALYVNLAQDFVLPEIELDEDGFAVTAPTGTESGLQVDPAEVPDALAANLSSPAEESGPAVFAPGPHTSEAAASLAQSVDRDTQAGLNPSLEVVPGDYPPLALSTAEGGALVLLSTRSSYTFSAPEGRSLNLSSGLEGLVEPGSYRSLTRHNVNMVGALVPPAGSDRQVEVIGSNGGLVAAETT